MFKVQRMSKLLIAASKDNLEPIVRVLYKYNAFDIEDFVEQNADGYEGFKIGKPTGKASEQSAELLRIRSIENIVGANADDIKEREVKSAAVLSKTLAESLPAIEKEASELVNKRNTLEAGIRECDQKLADLQPFADFPYELSVLTGYDGFTAVAGHIEKDVELPVPAEKYFKEGKDNNLFVAVVAKSDVTEVNEFLSKAGFVSVPIPAETDNAGGAIGKYTHEKTRLENEMAKLNEQTAQLNEKHASFLVACDEMLTADVERAEAPLRFATTDLAFVAEGWVPSDKVAEITAALEQAAGGKVHVEEEEVDYEKENVPIEYNNPDFSKPTEALMDIYSRPQYNEFDPTLLVAIAFPIFFGFILGDIAYGLILLALSFGLRGMVRDSIAGNKLLDVLRNASIMSIIFGFLFSEFLGFGCPWEPIIMSRHFNIGAAAGSGHGPEAILLLVVAAWVGILHITLGRALHIRNARVMHAPSAHRSKLIFAQLGWILVMWGILFIIWTIGAIPLMPDLTNFAAVAGVNIMAAIGAVLIVIGIIGIGRDNALELMELPTIISHVLSYARLAAVGLSSVAIAAVINYISIGMMISPALDNFTILNAVLIVVGLFVFVVGHIFNTALGLLSGGLHSIRLHYVEFFTKFYEGGGRRYEPFGIIRKFTKED